MSFLNRFGNAIFWVLVLAVSVSSYGNTLSALAKAAEVAETAAKAAKAAEVARVGAIAADAAKVVAVAGHTALVVGRVGACVTRASKTAPKDAAEKSCYEKYEDCVKKSGDEPEGDKVNDRCVAVVNKNLVSR
jgi:hypothetical protein